MPSTRGAGDVFHGAYALALALAESMSTHDAARFARVAASLKCEVFGGHIGVPNRDAVAAYFQRSALGRNLHSYLVKPLKGAIVDKHIYYL